MIEKPKRPKQLNIHDRQPPRTLQELINRYDLDNTKIYDFLDELIGNLNIAQEESQKGTIVESNLSSTNGYIRYGNGLQIAWKSATVTAGGNAWSGTGVYYSDHEMGNWVKPFTNIFNAISTVNMLTFWTTCSNYTNTSAGTIRAYRPNNTTQSATVSIISIGFWK